jgi:hypoxanthine phosphoribosyltransferase
MAESNACDSSMVKKSTIMTEATLTELIPEESIRIRIRELGSEISGDFRQHGTIHLVSVLKGAVIFTADLMRSLAIPCTIDFLTASSYGDQQISSGSVSLAGELSLQGRHVLIVEDIVDTGLCMHRIRTDLLKQNPASLSICTLLDKPSRRKFPVVIHYCGFTVPDCFVVGYGTDHAEKYRHLPFIGTLNS